MTKRYKISKGLYLPVLRSQTVSQRGYLKACPGARAPKIPWHRAQYIVWLQNQGVRQGEWRNFTATQAKVEDEGA